MVIYHAIPAPHPQNLPRDVSRLIRNDIRALNSEMLKTLQKLLRLSTEHSPNLIYLFEETNSLSLLQEGDTLCIHGEGFPFLLGPTLCRSPYTLVSSELANVLNQRGLVNARLTIKLISCNSGTNFEGRTYAQDLSSALHHLYSLRRPTVEGYNGYIVVKNNGKYSACSNYDEDRGRKGAHASTNDVSVTYKRGKMRTEPRKVLLEDMNYYGNSSDEEFSWAKSFISKTRAFRSEISIFESNFDR